MEDISLIKDATNLILSHWAYPSSSSGMTHFEGPLILAKPFEQLSVSMDMDMGSNRVDPTTTTGS